MLAVVALAAVAVVAVGHVGQRLVAQQRAQAGADAAALAAVGGGRAAADESCRANGCTVVSLGIDRDDGVLSARVTVEVGGARARARAAMVGG